MISEFQGPSPDGGWRYYAERLSATDRHQMAGEFYVKAQKSAYFIEIEEHEQMTNESKQSIQEEKVMKVKLCPAWRRS